MPASRILRNTCSSLLVIFALYSSHAALAQTALTNVTAGNTPVAVAVNAVTNKAYVVNRVGNSVTVIDGATNTTATVTVGSGPKAIGVNPLTNKIYVANGGGGTVTVIDGATNATSTVTVGTIPDGVAVNPVTNKIYVTNAGSGTVTVIDGVTNGTASVSTGIDPFAVAVNTVTNKIYVSHYSTVHTVNTVTVIDGATNDTATVTTGTNPYAVGVNEVTNKIYVANLAGGVTVIDGASNATTTVAAGTYPYAVSVNPVTNKIYVANEGSANVTEIDGATNGTSTITVGTDPQSVSVNPLTNQVFVGNYGGTMTAINGATSTTVSVAAGTNPAALAVNPVTNQVYVANGGSANVTVVDGASYNPTTVGIGPEGLAVNPVTNKFYATDYQHLKVIDGATFSMTSITLGRGPAAVAVNPATNKIYATNIYDQTVSVVDGASNTVTATVAVGANPTAIAVNTITNKIYVVNNDSNTVTVIDGATNGTAAVPTGDFPLGIAVNPVTNKIYVSNGSGGTVTVIDGLTNTTITTSSIGEGALGVSVNPVTNKIYVAGYLNSGVIDGVTNAVTSYPDLAAQHVTVNSLTNEVYFAGERSLWVVDGATNHHMYVVEELAYPGGISALADLATNDVYVGNGKNATLAVDGATNTTAKLSIGGGTTIAINPATGQIAMSDYGYNTMSIFRPSTAEDVPVAMVVNGVVDPYTLSGLQLFATANTAPSFAAQVTSNFSPNTPAPAELYYQLDTQKGAWQSATMVPTIGTSGLETNSATYNFSLANVIPGLHTVYVYAMCGNETSSVVGYTFEVVNPTQAVMMSPTPGSTLTGGSATFSWSAGAAVTQYSLYVGTTPGAHDVAYVNAGTSLSTTVNGIPTNANPLYVTLYSLISGKYYANASMYTEAGTPVAATLTSPTPGSTLTGASTTFSWTAGAGVSNYSLYVGTTLGAHDVSYVNAGKNTSTTVTGIPTSGGTLYVTLYSLINGTYQSHSYTYIEAGTASKATMVSPANGSTLHGLSQTFTWKTGTGVTSYSLYVGTTMGAHDLDYVSTTATSTTIGNLPAINTTIYVRLYSLIAGSWQYADYSYVSAP